MAERRAADGLDVKPCGHDKTQPKDACARDFDRGIHSQHSAIFSERKGVLGLDANVRFHGRCDQDQKRRPACIGSLARFRFNGKNSRRSLSCFAVPERAADRQAGNLSLKAGGKLGRKILQIDRRKTVCPQGVQLHFVARADSY